MVLRRTRRFGPRLLVAANRVAHRLTLTGSIDAEAREAFLSPEAVPGPQGAGRGQAGDGRDTVDDQSATDTTGG